MPAKSSQNRTDDSYEEHYLVKKLVGTSKSGNIVTLLGYMGKSESELNIRLYTNLEFNEYFEINKNDILHKEEVPTEEMEFGGTRIWIDGDSAIKQVYMEVIQEQAKFLTGRISRGYIKRRHGRKFASGMRQDIIREEVVASEYTYCNCTEGPECSQLGCTMFRSACPPDRMTTRHPCYTLDWPHGGMNC